jgi:SAM-dependent methyltransferase
MTLAQYGKLWQVSRQRIHSEADYRAFQAYQAELLLAYLQRHQVQVTERLVLDLGSGIGGYSEAFARNGARVISMDLMSQGVRLLPGCAPVAADALAIPLADNAVHLVFCASLIEHVPAPERLLAEIERVLAPGAYCYLSFPPYYSPMGGHEYAPFHYLGERTAMRLSAPRRMRRHPQWVRELYQVEVQPKSFADGYADWGLFRMTVGKAERLLAATSFEIVDLSTRYMPVSFVRWPVLREVLTWHVQFLLRVPRL